MFGGMTNSLGIASTSNSRLVSSLTEWYTTDTAGQVANISIPNKPGFTAARVTCINPGLDGYLHSDYDTGGGAFIRIVYGGNGGDCSTSIIALSETDNLVAAFTNNTAAFTKSSIVLVRGDIGEVTFRGGAGQERGTYYGNASGSFGSGGGGGGAGTFSSAGGTAQQGASGFAGLCNVWTRQSDGLSATAGSASNYLERNGVDKVSILGFGFGAGAGVGKGKGLVVVEWGITTPF